MFNSINNNYWNNIFLSNIYKSVIGYWNYDYNQMVINNANFNFSLLKNYNIYNNDTLQANSKFNFMAQKLANCFKQSRDFKCCGSTKYFPVI